jgi:hypothetical protein
MRTSADYADYIANKIRVKEVPTKESVGLAICAILSRTIEEKARVGSGLSGQVTGANPAGLNYSGV